MLLNARPSECVDDGTGLRLWVHVCCELRRLKAAWICCVRARACGCVCDEEEPGPGEAVAVSARNESNGREQW